MEGGGGGGGEDGESDGERGELWGRAGKLNLHARRVIWHRHGILGMWRLEGKYERSAV